MGRTVCTELQCLYKDALYLYLYKHTSFVGHPAFQFSVIILRIKEIIMQISVVENIRDMW